MTEPRRTSPTLTLLRRDAVELPSLRVDAVIGEQEASVPLGFEPVVVGSDPESTVVIPDPRVSRRHCSITLGEDGVVLRDLGSKNGTFVGGLRVREVLLGVDVLVSVGAARLSLREVASPSALALSVHARFGEAVGGSIPMRALFARLAQAAPSGESILLRGEPGTGKELLARAIHDASSQKDGPFVVFDCSAVAPHLVEADLFGCVRGAFTGAVERHGFLEEARGGSLFLDEIGELPLDLQPKLLRALEARRFRRLGSNTWQPFEGRVIAATHRDLRAASSDGSFRADLFYRLAVVDVRVPPLRERGEDLELLVERILAAQTPPRTIHTLPPNTMAMLRSYAFPGNVRELKNVLARVTLFPDLGRDALDAVRRSADASSGSDGWWSALQTLALRDGREQLVEKYESSYVAAKLRECSGNVASAARSSGVSRQFFYRLMERYGIRSHDS